MALKKDKTGGTPKPKQRKAAANRQRGRSNEESIRFIRLPSGPTRTDIKRAIDKALAPEPIDVFGEDDTLVLVLQKQGT
jgi:hypothetical protein